MVTSTYLGTTPVLVAEQDYALRRAIRACLFGMGFREIILAATSDALRRVVENESPDLVVANVALPGPSTLEMLRMIRSGVMGNNPFVVFIAVSGEPTPELVREAVDAGIDDLMTLPMAPGYIETKVEMLIHRRKQFVVTSDYVGPDRRKSSRDGGDVGPIRFDAPNTLKAKTVDRMNRRDVEIMLKEAINALNVKKFDRLAEFCIRLLGEIHHLFTQAEATQAARNVRADRLARLVYCAEEMVRRGETTPHAAQISRCMAVANLGRSLITEINRPSPEYLRQIPILAKQIAIDYRVDPAAFIDPEPGTTKARAAG